ncbi:Gfo/Idh/MocA family oxidoreductase [Halorubrum sp. GN11_10-6_MGM]|uniref:Gfo/Idh/MocA family protein n=1 Tax=Halorubrum sp. GN11_10-6_MGM TaxID=2518112 RepID=UPI0010F544D6|nr:Gfo/Idh/MocA family oxidoreductase [Halorubrum sp. GN11_10-6_MGM]TKX75052.1 Gfo/Idh/MocA family oxidoreductase [Halorubrum sp. GN11_10-6_MGM]
MIQIGIVGCGVIGNRLAAAIDDHERYELAAACDLDADRAASLAADHGTERTATTTDHTDLVETDGLDAVYVGVPPLAHREVVADALAADKHVICEKPIAADAATGRELVALAEGTDRVTAVNLPFRYTPGFVRLREAVAAGEIGEPRRVELQFRFPQWPREWQDVAWLESREQGGPLREVGTHFLFGVQELFGPVEAVSADVGYSGPETYEDDVVGSFRADGVRGTVDLLCDHEGEEENSITVVGDEASLSLTHWYRLVRNRGREDAETLVDERGDTVRALLTEFADAVEGDDGDLVSFAEAARVQEILDAIHASDGDRVRPGSDADWE